MEPTAIALVISTAGFVVASTSLVLGRRAQRRRREREVSWAEVHGMVRQISGLMRGQGFKPDAVVAVHGPPALLATLIIEELGAHESPLQVAAQEARASSQAVGVRGREVVTTGWVTTVPEAPLSDPLKRVLVVDDSLRTGDTLAGIVRVFRERGFDSSNVKTAALLVSESVAKSGKAPDFVAAVGDLDRHIMPWGRASRGARERGYGPQPARVASPKFESRPSLGACPSNARPSCLTVRSAVD